MSSTISECFHELQFLYMVLDVRKPYIVACELQRADQPAHPRSLIRIFVIRFLKGMISKLVLYTNFNSLALFCKKAGGEPWIIIQQKILVLMCIIAIEKNEDLDEPVYKRSLARVIRCTQNRGYFLIFQFQYLVWPPPFLMPLLNQRAFQLELWEGIQV